MENKETIGQLYELFSDEIFEQYESTAKRNERITKLEDEFFEELDKEKLNILDEIFDYKAEIENELNKHTFIFGFRLAIKLFAEGIYDNITIKTK